LFVAIGALHLGGPRGVLELLRQQGYRVDAN
ncbi:TraB/GumN family protein, partial [Burkholderia ubonensis]